MIVLFTDFGPTGPYVGQVTAAIWRHAPGARIVELFSDLPAHDPKAAAYLLPAYAGEFPAGTVFLCVVDPGVGGGRSAGILHADGCWYVGPGNGIFELVVRRARATPRWWEIKVDAEAISASFHGRDVFAPAAARLARGEVPDGPEAARGPIRRLEWPDDLPEVVYVDRFGNVMIGLRAASLPPGATIGVGGIPLIRARTFSDVPEGAPFWYENANGLVEIAVNRGRADEMMGLRVGKTIEVTHM